MDEDPLYDLVEALEDTPPITSDDDMSKISENLFGVCQLFEQLSPVRYTRDLYGDLRALISDFALPILKRHPAPSHAEYMLPPGITPDILTLNEGGALRLQSWDEAARVIHAHAVIGGEASELPVLPFVREAILLGEKTKEVLAAGEIQDRFYRQYKIQVFAEDDRRALLGGICFGVVTSCLKAGARDGVHDEREAMATQVEMNKEGVSIEQVWGTHDLSYSKRTHLPSLDPLGDTSVIPEGSNVLLLGGAAKTESHVVYINKDGDKFTFVDPNIIDETTDKPRVFEFDTKADFQRFFLKTLYLLYTRCKWGYFYSGFSSSK